MTISEKGKQSTICNKHYKKGFSMAYEKGYRSGKYPALRLSLSLLRDWKEGNRKYYLPFICIGCISF